MEKKKRVFVLLFQFCLAAFAAMGVILAVGCGDGNGSGHSAPGTGDAQNIRISEVMFVPSDGPEWVELYNMSTDEPAELSLVEVRNAKGDAYRIPEGTPPVPPGGYALILFGNQGDALTSTHDGANCVVVGAEVYGDFFDDTVDSCTVYSMEGAAIDFVAWGDYGHSGHYVSNTETYGGDGPVNEGESIGIHPDEYGKTTPTCWVIFTAQQTSQGTRNPIPMPKPLVPFEATNLADASVSFAWKDWYINTKEFHLQVDDDEDFNSPEISATSQGSPYHSTLALPSGLYYWRVRTRTANFEESPWSEIRRFTIQSETRSALRIEADLNMEPVLQRKDTSWLCTECAEIHDKHQWDKPHAFEKKSQCPHCKAYCGRACVAMINKFFLGKLSQDRISYEIFKSSLNPADQLGHGRGLSGTQIEAALAYALMDHPVCKRVDYAFDTVMEHINAGRPLIGVCGEPHVVVIDGYEWYEDPFENRIHVLQPYTGEQERVKNTETTIWTMWPIPANSRGIDAGDPEANSDTDPIKDFDEVYRFGTKPSERDSDDDELSDDVEIYAWVFGKGTGNRYPSFNGRNIWLWRNYDNDPYEDGKEDFNKNGSVDPGECDPFVAEKPLKVTLEVAGADGGSPSARVNGQSEQPIEKTGNYAGYFSRVVSFLWCGLLKVGSNSITFMALKSGSNDAFDDIQIQNIQVLDQDNNKVLLEAAGPFHLGDNTVASIYEEWEAGKWNDPNPPAFWVELHGISLTLDFSWTGYELE